MEGTCSMIELVYNLKLIVGVVLFRNTLVDDAEHGHDHYGEEKDSGPLTVNTWTVHSSNLI
jgi:hypothetical protein